MNGKLATGCSGHRLDSTHVHQKLRDQQPSRAGGDPSCVPLSCPEVPRFVLGIASLAGESQTFLVRERCSHTLPKLQGLPGPAENTEAPALGCAVAVGAGISWREPIPADAASCSEPRALEAIPSPGLPQPSAELELISPAVREVN